MLITSSQESNKVTKIREVIENFFEIANVRHEPFNEKNNTRATFTINSRFNHVTVYFLVRKNSLILSFTIPVNAIEKTQKKIAEYLLRANYGNDIGGFDFNFDNGEISYRIPIYCGEEDFKSPTYEQISRAIVVGMTMVKRYSDGLMNVMYGLTEPVDAVAEAEKDEV
ncbi:MAG: YbjN domain-containing protein [Selenomonadaceae bacterium]|nr:YbjN domain-containing protein [Selenomonadaceae bacterium]